MKLPPLPKELAAFAETQARHCALNDMVQAYGQQCREQLIAERDALAAAAKLALDALESLFGVPAEFTGVGGGAVAVWRLGGSDKPRKAITALRQAGVQ